LIFFNSPLPPFQIADSTLLSFCSILNLRQMNTWSLPIFIFVSPAFPLLPSPFLILVFHSCCLLSHLASFIATFYKLLFHGNLSPVFLIPQTPPFLRFLFSPPLNCRCSLYVGHILYLCPISAAVLHFPTSVPSTGVFSGPFCILNL